MKPLNEARIIKAPPKTIDDFGDVVKLREAFAPTERLYDKLRAQIKDMCRDKDPNEAYFMQGDRYTIKISPCAFESQVDIPAARKRLGAERFLSACSMTLRALTNLLPRPEAEALTISVQTTSRTFTPVAIAETVESSVMPKEQPGIDRHA